LIAKAQTAAVPDKLYADAGYDAEWIHVQCREQWGVQSVIKPARHRADGQLGGLWRSGMTEQYLKEQAYGQRWAVESFFSGLKRTMGSMLTSRTPNQLLAEAAFRVLAYTSAVRPISYLMNVFNRARWLLTGREPFEKPLENTRGRGMAFLLAR